MSAAASAPPVVAGTPAKQIGDLGQEVLVLVVEFVGQQAAAKLRRASRTFKVRMVYMVSWGLNRREFVVTKKMTEKISLGWFPVIGRNPDESNGRAAKMSLPGR